MTSVRREPAEGSTSLVKSTSPLSVVLEACMTSGRKAVSVAKSYVLQKRAAGRAGCLRLGMCSREKRGIHSS